MSTTNILTHRLPKLSTITFVQLIGSEKSDYPHSIGINGPNIFAISAPNLALRFEYRPESSLQNKMKSR